MNGPTVRATGAILGSVGSKALVRFLDNGNLNYALYGLASGNNTFTKVGAAVDNIDGSQLPFGANLDGWFYYRAVDLSGPTPDGMEVWRTNGTVTQKVTEIGPGTDGSNPGVITATTDRVYFTADDGTGTELYATTGASAGLKVLTSTASNVQVSSPVANGNTLYFINSNATTGDEPWKSTGTAASTQLVKDVDPGPAASASSLHSFKGGFAMLRGGRVYYSNGTSAGTVLLTDKAEGGFGLAYFTPTSGGRAYFSGGFEGYGSVVWRTDGTPDGTLALTAGAFDPPNANGVQSASHLATLGDDDDIVYFGRTPSSTNLQVHLIDRSAPDLLRTNQVLPAMSAAPVAGTVVNASKGTWTRDSAGTKYEYQWLLNGVPIPEGSAQTSAYYVNPAHVGGALSVRVTATGIGAPNVVEAFSAAATIAAPPTNNPPPPPSVQSFSVTKAPKISGKAKVGKKLTVSAPGLAPGGATFLYRWFANSKVIKGATGTSLKLKAQQKGKKITAQVTATRAGFTPLTLTTGPTGKVKGKPKKK